MQKAKILVTGATGKTGSAVVEQLRRHEWPVRALVRRRDERSARLAALGAEVVVSDMFDPDQMHSALRGVQRAYYLPLFQPYMTQAATVFALAARESKLEAVVQLSQWLSHRAHPSILTRETWLVDQLLSMIPGVAHVVVNPGMFADNFLRVIDFASLLHVYPVLTGDSRSAPVANQDIARVVAAILMDVERHAGKRYRPTGPQLLSGREMAAIVAKVVGHTVMPLNLPFWMFVKAARMSGADVHEVYNYRHYLQDHQQGAFSLDGGVTDAVERLTGAPAEDFETTARRYAALPFARQTLGRRLAAFARFNLLPLYPGYDLSTYERRMRFPRPPQPSLSSEDARWLEAHGGPGSREGSPSLRASFAGSSLSPVARAGEAA
jgi:uncharacterized protein YbjT (DUF2867 family)